MRTHKNVKIKLELFETLPKENYSRLHKKIGKENWDQKMIEWMTGAGGIWILMQGGSARIIWCSHNSCQPSRLLFFFILYFKGCCTQKSNDVHCDSKNYEYCYVIALLKDMALKNWTNGCKFSNCQVHIWEIWFNMSKFESFQQFCRNIHIIRMIWLSWIYYSSLQHLPFNKLAKLGDAIAISNLKLSITDPLTHSLTDWQG